MSDKQQEQDRKAQELQVQYNSYQEALTELQSQLSSITSQYQEHIVVDKTLAEIPPDQRAGRKCFKMIGGVLVDKSVDEVIVILDQEKKDLEKSRAVVEAELKRTRTEMDQWMAKNKVKIVRQ